MDLNNVFYIGFISKAIGYKGEVSAVLDVDNPENYKDLESVFLLTEEKLIPFFIEQMSIRSGSNHANIKFNGINSEKEVENILNCELYLPLENLPKLTGNQFYFHEIIGFIVEDIKYGEIGKVEEVIEYPSNPLMQIKKNSNEVLVPLKKELIKKVDRSLKKIIVETPEGLLDL